MSSYIPPSKRAKVSACVNCGIHTEERFCEFCRILTACKKCYKRLQPQSFKTGSDICFTCANDRKERRKYSLGRVFQVFDISVDESCVDLESFIIVRSEEILNAIGVVLEEQRSIKFFITIDTELYRPTVQHIQHTTARFRSNIHQIGNVSEVDLHLIAKDLGYKLDLFNERGSGWLFGCVIRCTLSTAIFRPLAGSSFMRTPTIIHNKKAVVNVENNDNKCFIWSILAHLHPASDHPNRLYHYKTFENELNVDGLTFPLPLSDVGKFEKMNKHLKINVLTYEEKDFLPLYVSKCHDRPIHINLLLLSDGSKQHYVLIRNMSRLIASRSYRDGKSFVCDYCLHPFTVKSAFDRHVPVCCTHTPQRVVYPKPGSILQWTSTMKTERIPFVIYSDFESFLVPGSDIKNVVNEHFPSGYCCHTVSKFRQYETAPTLYSGEDVMTHFFKHLLNERERISKILSKNEPMKPLTEKQMKLHAECTSCQVCEQTFTPDNWKVHHHCHISGLFEKSTCNNCNMQLKPQHVQENKSRRFVINVVIHNLRGYDAHLILKHFDSSLVKCQEISIIANTTEKYISFQFGAIKFLDSLQFLSCSLDELVRNLEPNQFIQTNKYSMHAELVRIKGVYPYEYMNGPHRFKETCLPAKEAFYSNLTEEHISEDEYERAQSVWKKFDCKTLQDYHDIYLKTDVLLLADIFETFRTLSLDTYKLDPVHYYSLPGLSWDALLKSSKVKLELISDPEIYLFLENSIRGGVSMISHRYSRANNQLVDGYDESQPNKYILYVDANNLYAFGMQQFLPMSDFRFLDDEEIAILNVDSIDDTSSTGYILQVDLEYPSELHDLHNCYPLAPEKIKIKPEMLSPYSNVLSTGQTMTEKLVPNLMDKTNYVLHYRNLKLYTRLGLKVTKIHRVLAFTQGPWMHDYIELNTKLRQKSKNAFQKDFFKFLNNACFGKTLQDSRGHKQIHLVCTQKRAKKLIAKPTFKYSQFINEDLVCIEMMKPKILLDKPIYSGFSILDLSKELMYKFHYNVMKRRYGSDCKLLMTDTDSLMYEICCKNVYEDMWQNLELYDTSNYSSDNKLFCMTNAKVVGLMKDETAGIPISEFVGLKPKMYSFVFGNSKPKLVAKGVKKSFVKNHVTHDMFHETLKNKTVTRAQYLSFRSFQHKLYTIANEKVCLSAYDDKRYILDDGIETLAYGHYTI